MFLNAAKFWVSHWVTKGVGSLWTLKSFKIDWNKLGITFCIYKWTKNIYAIVKQHKQSIQVNNIVAVVSVGCLRGKPKGKIPSSSITK